MYTFSPATRAESAKVNQNFVDLSTGLGDNEDNSLQLFRGESFNNFVATDGGAIWSLSSGLNGSMTEFVGYVISTAGLMRRIEVAQISSYTFLANSDTYVDVDSNGAMSYNPLANGTAEPAIASGYMRIAKIVTNGSTITGILGLCSRSYDEIARATLYTSTDTFRLSNIPYRKILLGYVTLLNSGQQNCTLQVNNDTGNNYSCVYSTTFAAPITSTSVSSVPVELGSPTNPTYTTLEIYNEATKEKFITMVNNHGAVGAGNAPTTIDLYGKWSNTTDVITSITFNNAGTGDLAAGSDIIIKGIK